MAARSALALCCRNLHLGESDSAFPFADLETARLFLRVLALDDTESVYRHFSDDQVTKHMDISSCARLEDAQEIIVFHLEDSGCRWGLFDKETGALAGTCGYHCWVKDDATSVAEIGFDLGTAYWSLGIMHEVLETTISYGFDEMRLRMIHASVEPENQRAMRLLGKLHFRPEPALRDGLKWFNLYRGDWNARAT